MKRLTGFLSIVFLAASLSVSAQNEPKKDMKKGEKMECKMGKRCKMSCCSGKDKKEDKSSSKKN